MKRPASPAFGQRLPIAESARLYALMSGGPSRVALMADMLHIIRGKADSSEIQIPIESVNEVIVRRSWFWHRFTVRDNAGTEHSIGGLEFDAAKAVADTVMGVLASRLGATLVEIDARVRQQNEGDHYARYSASQALRAELEHVLAQVRPTLRSTLSSTATQALQRLASLGPRSAFEAARDDANSQFIRGQADSVRQAARGLLSAAPTEEQTQAIATDEDVTLVLAGAGTGKTAAITGKVAHLVRNQGVSAAEILVLAFNRKAAAEIRERLRDGLAGAEVATFHSFGRRVISESNASAPTVSKFAEDESALSMLVEQIIVDLLTDHAVSARARDFIAYHLAAYRSPFDFDSSGAYYDYVRSSELRTLNGDLVKSFEELMIANFMSLNGVPFEYERPYEQTTTSREYRQYLPDFYIPGANLYLEHFALDRGGQAPPGWKRYLEGVQWKRSIHADNGTHMVETYSWQRGEGTLLEHLQQHLVRAGVTLRPVPVEDLVRSLKATHMMSRLNSLLVPFLHQVRTRRLDPKTLQERAATSSDPARSSAFLEVFGEVRTRYERRLAEDGTVDFDDLVNQATDHIAGGRWKPPYRYILVDEFQDISTGRMALLEALQQPSLAYFLVGDDWQSIYRFAGSDVSLVQHCDEHLGFVRHRALSQTFRFGDGILTPSTAFVRRNPIQTQRELRPAREVRDYGVIVVGAADPADGLKTAIEDIEAHLDPDPPALSVLVLGRYRHSRRAVSQLGRRATLEIEFSTVHSAKGKEADYVVVLDLQDDKLGFPSQIEDDPLLELVFPEGEGYPFAEERRLFYVALTRARRGAYLVTDRMHPSAFVRELIERNSPRQIGELVGEGDPLCPRCATGRLIASRSGKNLRCSNYSLCQHLAPGCPGCGEGYLVAVNATARCTTQECTHLSSTCPECEVGVLLERDGRYGKFMACSEYRAEPPCSFTRNIAPRRDSDDLPF